MKLAWKLFLEQVFYIDEKESFSNASQQQSIDYVIDF